MMQHKYSLKYKGHMTENAHYLTKKLQNRNFYVETCDAEAMTVNIVIFLIFLILYLQTNLKNLSLGANNV